MARKRTLNRRDLREQSDAATTREKDDEEPEEEEEAAADDDAGDDDEAAKPKKKAPPRRSRSHRRPKTATKRTRAPKEVRMRAVWVVFDNASKRVDTFPYNQRADAEELLAKKQEEKKGTFYISARQGTDGVGYESPPDATGGLYCTSRPSLNPGPPPFRGACPRSASSSNRSPSTFGSRISCRSAPAVRTIRSPEQNPSMPVPEQVVALLLERHPHRVEVPDRRRRCVRTP